MWRTLRSAIGAPRQPDNRKCHGLFHKQRLDDGKLKLQLVVGQERSSQEVSEGKLSQRGVGGYLIEKCAMVRSYSGLWNHSEVSSFNLMRLFFEDEIRSGTW